MKLTDPIATKFVPPARAAHLVDREALVRRLDEGATSRRLTLVHAPAGYGKTSLLSQWYAMLKVRGLEVIGGQSIHRVTAAAFAAARPGIWPGGLHPAPVASAGGAAFRAPSPRPWW